MASATPDKGPIPQDKALNDVHFAINKLKKNKELKEEFEELIDKEKEHKELKGFELVELKAGETKTVSFVLGPKELGFYNNQGKFLVEEGDFEVFIGGDSSTNLKTTFTLK